MNYKKINNLTGWVVCLIACMVYILTAEAAGSLWDCGEFVSSCYKVQVPHPPGAPLFVLLGRIFIVLFGDNPLTAAKAVNIMNALASGFTILFLFWSITYLAKKIIAGREAKHAVLSGTQILSIMGAGAVGALAYTFSDTFWYSAVEGEVYALSSFFTAIVFWVTLKWDENAEEPGADKWLVFFFFLIGLSIGVHLLCILAIPAVVIMYFFRKREHFNYAIIRKYFIYLTLIGGVLASIAAYFAAQGDAFPEYDIPSDNTVAGLLFFGTFIAVGVLFLVEKLGKGNKELYGGTYIFFLLGCAITGVMQIGVIQYSIKAAGYFDIFFVDTLSLPFFSGFIAFFVLLAVAVWYGLRIAAKKGWYYLRLALWCFSFVLIGYSSYVTTMIRSSANPAIDMFNVDNPMTLVGYLSRDQYGDFPLLYGQKYTANPIHYKTDSDKYQKSETENKYVVSGKKGHYIYAPDDKMILPRMWDGSNDQGHYDYYASFMGFNKMNDGSYRNAEGEVLENSHINFRNNVSFFIGYQSYYMYFRYFMWNFSGKQNDVQGVSNANSRDGNWITGISFIDNMMYGDQSLMPDSMKNNKANNKLFMLPFILGLLGFFYHLKRRSDDTFATFLLFFFTGFAIILYLNQPGNQPRERDYAYVGSFYVFAIWIGLGVLQIIDWFGAKMNKTTATGLAIAICLLAVPAVMAQQEWDDHDRSNKRTAPDLAKAYLESCAPNAILFYFGDNDTYPLWYAQEVEGVRPDIRVINTSLLGIDWYINQLRNKINQSDAIDVIFTAAQIEGSKRDIIMSAQAVTGAVQGVLAQKSREMTPEDAMKIKGVLAGFDPNVYYDLHEIMTKYAASDDPKYAYSRGEDDLTNYMPVSKVSISVDTASVRKNGTVNANDPVLSEVKIDLPAKSYLFKNESAILNIIAANKWKRPIYFTNNYGDLGFGQYLRKDGISYRLVPVANLTESNVNTDWSYDKLMNKFGFANCNVPGVYFDEENRRHLTSLRSAYAELAFDLALKNRKEEARKVLEKADKMFLQQNFPYGMSSRYNMHNRSSLTFLEACYRADAAALADKVCKNIKTDLQQQLKYYNSLSGNKAAGMDNEKYFAQQLLQTLEQIEKHYHPQPAAAAPVDSVKK